MNDIISNLKECMAASGFDCAASESALALSRSIPNTEARKIIAAALLISACNPSSASPLTTKGDIWGFDVDDARIPSGADGLVLQADSSEPLGVKWVAASAPGAHTLGGASHTADTFANINTKFSDGSLARSIVPCATPV